MTLKHIFTVMAAGLILVPAYSQEPGNPSGTESTEGTAVADSIPDNYDTLEEFVVTAKKDVVKSDGAKVSYNLEEDDSSKGTSVLDALRKVPMVSVDGQDNIRIKGDTNFKIYVNGKEEPMLTANASKILKAMPAESVSKIEVITEPGAKYDAEGTGGILNLITERKQRKDGYAGSLSANFSSRNEGVSAYGRMKYDKFTADANFNYSDALWQKQRNMFEQQIINHESDQSYRTLTTSNQNLDFKYLGGGLNMSWEPTDKDLFSLSANIYSVDAGINSLYITNKVFSRSGQLNYAYNQNGSGSLENLGTSGDISYKRTFDSNGHSLIAAYGFNYGKQSMHLGYENENWLNSPLPYEVQKSLTDGYTREHTATIDYTNPLGDGKHTIETGVKGVFRHNTANSRQLTGNSWVDMVDDMSNRSLTRQIQNVYAAYATYSGTYGNVAVKAGLRYEHTYMGMDFLYGEIDNYRRNLDDVTPNAAVTYMFGPASNLRLAYQMRISRPSLEQMNPFKFQIYQGEIRMGNPDLESERYNSLTFTYSNFGRVLGGNVSLEAFQSNNTIEEYNYYEDNVHYQTYGNLGRRQRIALSGFLNWNITPTMNFSVNGSVNFTSIKSHEANLKNHSWNGNYGANFGYTGPWKVKYSLYGGQSTGDITLQGKWCGWYYYGLGISKSFLKDDALTLAVNASNFLTKYTHYHGYTNTPTHSMNFRGKNVNWNVGFSISWNFGHLQDHVKKTGADLENDDTKSTGKKGGGIGM